MDETQLPQDSTNQPESIPKNIPNSEHNKSSSDNVVFVGSKPLVNYIRSVSTLFIKKNAPEIIIRARGKFISKAVDIAEVARRQMKEISLSGIKIATESFEKEGKKTFVSTMDISLKK